MSIYTNVRIIVNPAAGQDRPLLAIMNRIFNEFKTEWDLRITRKRGDGEALARQAVEDGADLILVYGGDGTISEVVNGIYPAKTPLGILMGGTGNGAAGALQIPTQLEKALRGYMDGETCNVRAFDLGQVNDRVFLLRADVGEAIEIIGDEPDRETKDRFGILAYYWGFLKALTTPAETAFRLNIDGNIHESDGAACMIANLNNIGSFNLRLGEGIEPDDGMLDVFLVKQNLASVASLIASLATPGIFEEYFEHYRGKEIQVETDKPRRVLVDGESILETPATIRSIPGAINLLVPYKVNS